MDNGIRYVGLDVHRDSISVAVLDSQGKKSAATRLCSGEGPFRPFYEALLEQGIRPELARLTVARKLAAITLAVWKKGEGFDAQRLTLQAA